MEWLAALDANADSKILETGETNLLESRRFRFHCGCTLEKILPIPGGWKDRLDDLFEGENVISIQCPSCTARYAVTRDMI